MLFLTADVKILAIFKLEVRLSTNMQPTDEGFDKLNLIIHNLTKRLQGGPSGRGKPPVELDLGCSAILPGQ